MARASLPLTCLTLLSLAACGGGDAEPAQTVTVVKTQSAPPATPETTPSGPSGSTGTTGSTTEETPTETTPTAPLPPDTGGATAVQGKYLMRVAQSNDNVEFDEGEEVTWGAVTRCEPECVVELRRENANGGFKTLEMKAISETQYAYEGKAQAERCSEDSGPESITDRTSLSVKKQRDEGGVPLATEIEGFLRIGFECSYGTAEKRVVRFSGRLQE